MNTARTYADELLARFTEPAQMRLSRDTPANSAKPAKDKHSCGLAGHSALCEGLRKSANPGYRKPTREPGSQTFAGVRNHQNGPQSEQRRGISQDSQLSQGYPATNASAEALALVAWTDADIARFLDRRTRLMRWSWSEAEAEALAERLTLRDREADDRVSCAECAHYRLGRCGNHRRAGLQSADLGRELAGMLQRCPGFGEP